MGIESENDKSGAVAQAVDKAAKSRNNASSESIEVMTGDLRPDRRASSKTPFFNNLSDVLTFNGVAARLRVVAHRVDGE